MKPRQHKRRIEWSWFREAAEAWASHNAQRLGAALAYYAILSLAPLLLIFVGIGGMAFGRATARGEIYNQISAIAGSQSAVIAENLLRDAHAHPRSGIATSVAAVIMLLLGASGVFVELREDLNYIWDVQDIKQSGLMSIIRYRLFAFGLVIGFGLLVTLSLAVSIAAGNAENYAGRYISLPPAVIQRINFAATLVVTTILFGLIYTVFPQRRVPWSDVVVGSVVTSILFNAGNSAVAILIRRAGIGSSYGAAGSVVVFLVWIYYSSQIFLFGAEFTHVYSRRRGLLSRESRPGDR